MNDVRDLTRASKDFSRGVRAREPDDLQRFRVTDAPPSLLRPLAILFLVIVVMPAVLRLLYLALFVSPQYNRSRTLSCGERWNREEARSRWAASAA